MYRFGCSGLHQTGDKSLPEPMIVRILSLHWVIGSQCWACKSRRQSCLDCWHPETYAVSTTSMNHFCLWCSMVKCWQEQFTNLRLKFVNLTKVLEYLDKYFGHQVQVSTKYFWISKGHVQVSTKYSIICIKYQVQVPQLAETCWTDVGPTS